MGKFNFRSLTSAFVSTISSGRPSSIGAKESSQRGDFDRRPQQAIGLYLPT
jgi:hypothetical protein